MVGPSGCSTWNVGRSRRPSLRILSSATVGWPWALQLWVLREHWEFRALLTSAKGAGGASRISVWLRLPVWLELPPSRFRTKLAAAAYSSAAPILSIGTRSVGRWRDCEAGWVFGRVPHFRRLDCSQPSDALRRPHCDGSSGVRCSRSRSPEI